MDLPPEIGERRILRSEWPRVRAWIQTTRALAADGIVRPDIGELAELLVAVTLDGTRARRGEPAWDIRASDGSLVQVKAVWHLPHRRRQNLGSIGREFHGEIWVVEFTRELLVERVTRLPGSDYAGQRLRVRDALNGEAAIGWAAPAERLGLR